jgi:hypothetical protein
MIMGVYEVYGEGKRGWHRAHPHFCTKCYEVYAVDTDQSS